MATIAEMLVGSALEQSTKAPDLAGALSKGMELGLHVRQVQQQREQLEQQKEQLEFKKLETVGNYYSLAEKMPEGSARQTFLKEFVPKAIAALGMGDKIHPTSQKMLAAEPTIVPLLKAKLADRSMTFPEMLTALQDPAKLAGFMNKHDLERHGGEAALRQAAEDYPETLGKVYEKAVIEGNKDNRTAMQAEGKAEGYDRTDRRFNVNQYQAVKNDFDTNTKGVRDVITAGNTALGALNSNGPIAASAVRTQLARMSGEKGPLSESDIAMYGGSQDLLSRMATLSEKLTTGNIADATRKEYKVLITEYTKVAQAKIRDELERSRTSAKGLGLDPDRAAQVIAADKYLKDPTFDAKAKAAQIKAKLPDIKKYPREAILKKVQGLVSDPKDQEALMKELGF